jgi:tetratricopeptide (TPR) repeat protein
MLMDTLSPPDSTLSDVKGGPGSALTSWAALAARSPTDPAPLMAPIQALLASDYIAEALVLLDAAQFRFPDHAPFAVEAAQAAQRQGAIQDSLRRWQVVRDRFPAALAGITATAPAPRETGRSWAAAPPPAAAAPRPTNDPAPAIEHALRAQNQGDWPEALRRWAVVRERFPDQTQAYTGAALAHRNAGDFDAADAMLQAAMQRFPNIVSLTFEHGWVAHIRHDWPEAARRWETVRMRAPDVQVGYTAGATALRELGRMDEAVALLDEAARRFPGELKVTIEQAWLAQARRDWPEAARHWDAVRAQLPDEEAGYTAGARALREQGRADEAERLLREAIARFPDRRSPLTEYAWLAYISYEWPEAAERWAAVRARFPDHAEAYALGARALGELRRYEEAEPLLAEAMALLPNAADIASEHAWVAYHQKRWPEATERFGQVRKRFPNHPDGYVGGALTCRDQSLLDQAAAILVEGMERLPDQPRLVLDHALLPVYPIFDEKKNRPESLRRLQRLREKFPSFEQGYLQGMRLLRETHQEAAAEALAREGTERLPGNIELAVAYANAALEREDWQAAVERFRTVTARFPGFADGSVGLGRALAQSGDLAGAEAALQETMQRFPRESAPVAAYAQLAVRRQDWAEAVRRWEDAEARFPHEKTFSHRLYEARLRMTESDPAADPIVAATMAAQFAPAAKPDASAVDRQVSDLVMQFESLGGRMLGCEFGIFQRDCGAEPLGLLRWADMPYKGIVSALETRFAGVGLPENTELFVSAISGGRGEYCTRDHRDMMFMRAFIYEDEVPFDKMYASSCRRLQFLSRKLIEDLEQGTKIFVYRLTDRNLTDAEINRLHAATRSYGDNTLLYVRYEDAEHPNGTVELVRPGLMIGYIDRFKMSRTNELSAAPPTASWLQICRNASEIWSTLRA